MIGQLLEIPFGDYEGTGAVKRHTHVQNCDKMKIVIPESCECQKFSVPLRSQRTAERMNRIDWLKGNWFLGLVIIAIYGIVKLIKYLIA